MITFVGIDETYHFFSITTLGYLGGTFVGIVIILATFAVCIAGVAAAVAAIKGIKEMSS